MQRITNKHVQEHLQTLQNTLEQHKQLMQHHTQKLETIQQSLQEIQNNTPNKQTYQKLSKETKQSIMNTYLTLSLSYLGIGATILFSALQLLSLEYSIIFGVFFAGGIILASLAYLKKKEL